MTFGEWQQLTPDEAAREVHRRVQTRLAPAQQRAVLAELRSENALAGAFAASARGGPLGGVPYLVKDLFDVNGSPLAAGSTFLPEIRPVSTRDAAIVRAFEGAGATLAGKTQLHEFAYGITGENPHHGDCEAPSSPGRTSGGSSSGSAAAVAAGIVPLAIGTDTGGSIRVPAAFCGVFGFRMTPGDAWIADAFPLAPTFDTAGWFTADAGDMLAACEALVGPSSEAREPRGGYLAMPGLDPEVATACAGAAGDLAAPLPAPLAAELAAAFKDAALVYNHTVAREAWAIHEPWAGRFRDRYDPAVWTRLNRVHQLTAAEIAAANAGVGKLRTVWEAFFEEHDFMVLPATPCPALTKAECTLANRQRLLALTAPASVGGCPVLTVPVRLPGGLGTGLQIVMKTARSPVTGWVLRRCRERNWLPPATF